MSAKVAIVAGAGGATGRATATVLAATGLTVVAVDRSEAGLHDLPDGVRPEVADTTDPALTANVVDGIAAEVGPPDVLVNTIGAFGQGDVLSTTPEQLDGAAAKKVTIISAPAGSGKTSLLRAWADRPAQPHRLAVVQVRRDQHDAQDFWLALLEAVRHVCGAPGGAEPQAARSRRRRHQISARRRWSAGCSPSSPMRRCPWLVTPTRSDSSRTSPAPTARSRSICSPRCCCREAITLAERHGWGTEPAIAPALVTLAGTMVWLGQFDEAERWLHRSAQALQTDTGPDIRLLLHHTTGILRVSRGRQHEALHEFSAAERLRSRLAGSHALASQVTGWLLATQARLGMTGEARAALAALDDDRAVSGEIANARAVICLADGNPGGALTAARDVLVGIAPVIGYVTVVEAYLLAGLACRELGDQRAANEAAERALALAEADRLVLPFAMTGSRELLEALPRHETAHAALLADILDVLRGASPAATDLPVPSPGEEISRGELKVLRYLPTNLSRHEIAAELSVSVNTVSTHIRSIYAKLQVSDRSSAVQRARELRLLAAAR